MIRLAGIDHVVFRVRDMTAMIAFYEDVLGASVERRVDDLGLVQLRAGSALIDLVDCAAPLGLAGGPPPGAEGRNRGLRGTLTVTKSKGDVFRDASAG